MKRLMSLIFAVSMLALAVGGCSTTHQTVSAYDEVLIYKLPYDLTYLRTVEVLQTDDNWELEKTLKEEGIIQVRNTNFSGFADSEKRVAIFLVKRIARGETSVQLAPESQRVIGADKLMKLVAANVSREL